jgi:hypothetical protein
LDIDGESWANPPSMGADELDPFGADGSLSMRITANYTNFATGYAAVFMADNSGPITQTHLRQLEMLDR